MKKYLFMICLAMVMAISAFAAEIDGIVFEDESVVPDIAVSGYPRFDTLSDGTLILVNSGTIRKSTDNGLTWKRKGITTNSATTVTTSSGKTHELARENWQGFVCDDGTVIVAYRARTKNYTSGEFYTSIRFMTSTDNGETFKNEVIVKESVTNSMHGYWEPFMIQTDANTVLIFYSDDLNVNNSSDQQNIVYHEYNLATKKIGDAVVAINGVNRNSRDGMPVITELRYGGYAMVIETHDFQNRYYGGEYYKSVFVIGLSLSEDGKTWSAPVPVAAPANPKGGDRCAAPYITTLPDGRVVISYMTEDGYTGNRVSDPSHGNCVYGAVISNDVITTDTVLTATKGGAASGFTTLPDIFDDPETGYMIWNTVYCDGEYLYFAGSAGTNNGSESSSVKISRAAVSASYGNDIDNDGEVTLKDALRMFKAIFSKKDFYKCDINNDGDITVADALIVLKELIG